MTLIYSSKVMIFCDAGRGIDLFTVSSLPFPYFTQNSFKGALGFDLKDFIFLANKLFFILF